MGIVLWVTCGVAAFFVARIVPAGRVAVRWMTDLALSLAGALGGGILATGLDFGGWAALDIRAGALAFCTALAFTGAWRAVAVRKAGTTR